MMLTGQGIIDGFYGEVNIRQDENGLYILDNVIELIRDDIKSRCTGIFVSDDFKLIKMHLNIDRCAQPHQRALSEADICAIVNGNRIVMPRSGVLDTPINLYDIKSLNVCWSDNLITPIKINMWYFY